jgi:ligand-binding sensor domain-containing protein
MRLSLLPLTISALLLSTTLVQGQEPFTISASPDSQTLSGATATYSITVAAGSGYTASVFLSASCPTLPGATLAVQPNKVNSPYTTASVMTVTVTGEKVPGTHQIIIEGKNGPSIARDTVTLTVAGKPAWRVFNTYNSPLPSNIIRAIEIDRDGVAWIGTEWGLASYDGTAWTLYDTATGFPLYTRTTEWDGRTIAGIAVDSSNNVWVLSIYGDLAKYSNGTWTKFKASETIMIPRGAGPTLAADDNGNIWIVTYDGLVKFDGTNFTSIYADYAIASVAVDHNGSVWSSNRHGDVLRKFDGIYWTMYSAEEIPLHGGHGHRSLTVDNDGNLWYIAHNGVAKFGNDTATGYPSFDHGATLQDWDTTDGFPGPAPTTMDFDITGTTWVGNGSGNASWSHDRGGLLRYDGTNHWYYTIANSGLPHDNISVVRAASDQSIWIGTCEGGLAILDGTAPPGSLFNGTSGVPSASSALAQLHLTGIWPNPASNRATVDLYIPASTHARLSVMNTLGEETMVVLDRNIEAGNQQLAVDLNDLMAGIYFLRLDVGGTIEASPLVVTR